MDDDRYQPPPETCGGGGVLSLPTGAGKTTVALHIACHFGGRTLIMVHTSVLRDQWAERIRAFVPGATVGSIQGARADVRCEATGPHDFVIATIQSLARMTEVVTEFLSAFETAASELEMQGHLE